MLVQPHPTVPKPSEFFKGYGSDNMMEDLTAVFLFVSSDAKIVSSF